MQIKAIVEKWYKALEFPKEFDNEFYTALSNIQLDQSVNKDNYGYDCQDGVKNLLYALYFCQAYHDDIVGMGIPEEVVLASLSEIVRWTITWSNVKGRLYLGEMAWISRVFNKTLFRIGRLQFDMTKPKCDQSLGITTPEPMLAIHIPSGGKLDEIECKNSIAKAKDFFAKHFPEFKYNYITCYSWLLDDNMLKFVSQDSNIYKFASMFKKGKKEKSNEIIKYLFTWDTTLENLKDKKANSSLAQKVKDAILSGETFYEVNGVLIE